MSKVSGPHCRVTRGGGGKLLRHSTLEYILNRNRLRKRRNAFTTGKKPVTHCRCIHCGTPRCVFTGKEELLSNFSLRNADIIATEDKVKQEKVQQNYDCVRCKKISIRGRPCCYTKFDSKVNRYECSFCGKLYKRPKELQKHQKAHFGIMRYKCNICSKRFFGVKNLRTHKLKHVKDRRKQNAQEVALQLRNDKKNNEDSKEFSPSKAINKQCSVRLRSFSVLPKSEAHQSPSRNEKYSKETSTDGKSDSDCKYSNNGKSPERNRSSKCSSGDKPEKNQSFRCSNEDKSPKWNQSSGDANLFEGNRIIQCTNADQSFKSTRRSSNCHIIDVDTGRKYYLCFICGKLVAGSSNLSTHLNGHMNSESLCCKICNRSFATKYNRMQHEKVKHSETVGECNTGHQAVNDRNFLRNKSTTRKRKRHECDLCEKYHSWQDTSPRKRAKLASSIEVKDCDSLCPEYVKCGTQQVVQTDRQESEEVLLKTPTLHDCEHCKNALKCSLDNMMQVWSHTTNETRTFDTYEALESNGKSPIMLQAITHPPSEDIKMQGINRVYESNSPKTINSSTRELCLQDETLKRNQRNFQCLKCFTTLSTLAFCVKHMKITGHERYRKTNDEDRHIQSNKKREIIIRKRTDIIVENMNKKQTLRKGIQSSDSFVSQTCDNVFKTKLMYYPSPKKGCVKEKEVTEEQNETNEISNKVDKSQQASFLSTDSMSQILTNNSSYGCKNKAAHLNVAGTFPILVPMEYVSTTKEVPSQNTNMMTVILRPNSSPESASCSSLVNMNEHSAFFAPPTDNIPCLRLSNTPNEENRVKPDVFTNNTQLAANHTDSKSTQLDLPNKLTEANNKEKCKYADNLGKTVLVGKTGGGQSPKCVKWLDQERLKYLREVISKTLISKPQVDKSSQTQQIPSTITCTQTSGSTTEIVTMFGSSKLSQRYKFEKMKTQEKDKTYVNMTSAYVHKEETITSNKDSNCGLKPEAETATNLDEIPNSTQDKENTEELPGKTYPVKNDSESYLEENVSALSQTNKSSIKTPVKKKLPVVKIEKNMMSRQNVTPENMSFEISRKNQRNEQEEVTKHAEIKTDRPFCKQILDDRRLESSFVASKDVYKIKTLESSTTENTEKVTWPTHTTNYEPVQSHTVYKKIKLEYNSEKDSELDITLNSKGSSISDEITHGGQTSLMELPVTVVYTLKMDDTNGTNVPKPNAILSVSETAHNHNKIAEEIPNTNSSTPDARVKGHRFENDTSSETQVSSVSSTERKEMNNGGYDSEASTNSDIDVTLISEPEVDVGGVETNANCGEIRNEPLHTPPRQDIQKSDKPPLATKSEANPNLGKIYVKKEIFTEFSTSYSEVPQDIACKMENCTSSEETLHFEETTQGNNEMAPPIILDTLGDTNDTGDSQMDIVNIKSEANSSLKETKSFVNETSHKPAVTNTNMPQRNEETVMGNQRTIHETFNCDVVDESSVPIETNSVSKLEETTKETLLYRDEAVNVTNDLQEECSITILNTTLTKATEVSCEPVFSRTSTDSEDYISSDEMLLDNRETEHEGSLNEGEKKSDSNNTTTRFPITIPKMTQFKSTDNNYEPEDSTTRTNSEKCLDVNKTSAELNNKIPTEFSVPISDTPHSKYIQRTYGPEKRMRVSDLRKRLRFETMVDSSDDELDQKYSPDTWQNSDIEQVNKPETEILKGNSDENLNVNQDTDISIEIAQGFPTSNVDVAEMQSQKELKNDVAGCQTEADGELYVTDTSESIAKNDVTIEDSVDETTGISNEVSLEAISDMQDPTHTETPDKTDDCTININSEENLNQTADFWKQSLSEDVSTYSSTTAETSTQTLEDSQKMSAEAITAATASPEQEKQLSRYSSSPFEYATRVWRCLKRRMLQFRSPTNK